MPGQPFTFAELETAPGALGDWTRFRRHGRRVARVSLDELERGLPSDRARSSRPAPGHPPLTGQPVSLRRCGGDLGGEDDAYRFVDFLVEAGQSIWQMLPD